MKRYLHVFWVLLVWPASHACASAYQPMEGRWLTSYGEGGRAKAFIVIDSKGAFSLYQFEGGPLDKDLFRKGEFVEGQIGEVVSSERGLTAVVQLTAKQVWEKWQRLASPDDKQIMHAGEFTPAQLRLSLDTASTTLSLGELVFNQSESLPWSYGRYIDVPPWETSRRIHANLYENGLQISAVTEDDLSGLTRGYKEMYFIQQNYIFYIRDKEYQSGKVIILPTPYLDFYSFEKISDCEFVLLRFGKRGRFHYTCDFSSEFDYVERELSELFNL